MRTESYSAAADGTEIHSVEAGEGTPVIVSLGAGGSAIGNWSVNGIAPALAPTNRVIGIDVRAHGLGEAGPEESRRRRMPTDVLEFMRQQTRRRVRR